MSVSPLAVSAGPISGVHGSSCADLDLAHIDSLVSTACATLREFAGAELRLHALMPPYSPQSLAPAGVMEFWLERGDETLAGFFLAFGAKDERRTPFAEEFPTSAREAAATSDPYPAGAGVDNFDELWLFACRFAEALPISRITISFGGHTW